ncbi:methylmalonyl-CoA mutase subunit beta [Nonomuraea sp. CA-143628]|uniref:methylmalonyl-CoA mutase subunit beta n=1 Tax=Nonomuraea sp. CA-143628 TaxID=3239997 RepID=UPI003D929372
MHLVAGFPPTNRDDWRALALEVLRKTGVEAGSPEEALSSITYDGVRLAPLYDAADLPKTLRKGAPGARAGWDVRQRHAVADPEAVLADLEHGVTSLWLVLGAGAIPVGRLADLLREVLLDLAPIVLEAGPEVREAAETLFGLAAERGVSPTGNLGASIGTAGRDTTAELAARCAQGFPGMRAVLLDATPYHDAGGSDADELGCSIALGVEHLRALTGAGLSVEQAFGQLEFRYAVTDDQFAAIAKLRAARTLWARVAEVCGAADGGQRQHAVTSSAMMTARDPWVNLLRTTIACFAAGVGGADAVTVQPFDACLGAPDAFARRMARNTQALLLEEAGAGRVADPAAGSWYVERRTADLADRAWAWFQEIEAAGGITAASGLVAERIAETRQRRADDIAHRRFPITGVSEFPHLDEKPVRRSPGDGAALAGESPGGSALAGESAEDGGAVADESPGDEGVPAGEGLPRIRYAREFEALRDLADAQPERPVVFLATFGPVAAHTARAAFAANLFQAGGLATQTAGPGTDPDQIATAFAVSGSDVACLCSSDKMYGLHAEAVAAALRRAGAKKIWLAGKGSYEGVDDRLYAGCDALAVLRTTFDDLEVTR